MNQTQNAQGINQWQVTAEVVECFTNIKRKNECTFIQFDICNFYPSIIENQLIAAIKLAKSYFPISDR